MTTPLEDLFRNNIAAHGPMTVEEYMEHCLYHPRYGYYTNGYNFLPEALEGQPYPHDFTTAPEITPLFGATMANWVARQWETLQKPFTLMECGPGRGTLMRDLLSHLQTAHPACYAAAAPLLVETSAALSMLQRSTLQAFPQCDWSHKPESDAPTILIGNEILDAFPHTQLVESEGRIQPRNVTLDASGALTFDVTGPITEHSPLMRTWLQSLPQSLHAALFSDYGAETTGPTGDTLQAIHRHQKVGVFHRPGETDLTTHVNFTNVIATLAESHPELEAQTLEHLSPFLMRHGLASLALADPQHPTPDSILHRLLHPSQMGTLFKVQCYTRTRP